MLPILSLSHTHRREAIKLQKSIGLYRLDLGFGNGFLKYNTKRTSNKWERGMESSLKLKTFVSVNDSTGLEL